MTTANDLVVTALKRSQIIDLEDTPSDAEAQHALTVMNQMIHGWRQSDVDLHHFTMVLTDTFALDESFDEGITCSLAARLASEKGYEVPQSVMIIAKRALDDFRAQLFEIGDDIRMDRALDARYFGNRIRDYDIESG